MKICIDACAYIDMTHGNEAIAAFLAQCEEIVVPAATFAELSEGFYVNGRMTKSGIVFGRFLDRENVHFRAADYAVADRYALIAHALRRRGRKIPANDIWIAATAFETGCSVLSYDRHFDEIDGLGRFAP